MIKNGGLKSNYATHGGFAWKMRQRAGALANLGNGHGAGREVGQSRFLSKADNLRMIQCRSHWRGPV